MVTVAVPFTVTAANRSMVGYKGTANEVLEIPAEFDGDDGKHYVVTRIGDAAFCDCASLVSVVIPDGVTSIGLCAFDRCSNLSSVVIPESVTSIKSLAFDGCTSLSSVVIPKGIEFIPYAERY